MDDLITALGMVVAIEGMLYALFPEGMKKAMRLALAQSEGHLRIFGLAAAIGGVAVVWLIRHN
jgi:uncharacterized protein YjeT (DUF2065 family)